MLFLILVPGFLQPAKKIWIVNYTKYSEKIPFPVRLCGAITNDGGKSKSIVPVGEDYILVPSRFSQHGVV